jgi:CubicO group peptidase (beta-lactamase class C family)
LNLLLLFIAGFCARPALAGPTTQLEADTVLTTASGATFRATKGWFLTNRDGLIVLEDPDRELSLVVAESPDSSADTAVAAAWKLFRPDFSRALRHKVSPPPRDGWDEAASFEYETTTQEGRFVWAQARRKGTTWYLGLIDGLIAAVDRRGAQITTALSSLRGPGVEEESFAGVSPHELDAARIETLEAFIEEARVKAEVPGAAVAIVRDGRIVYARGFGVREIGSTTPVTPSDLFLIGSTSKSLSTFMMARLVDEGRFGWDTPVTQLLPSFALADTAATRKLTMAHTVCACTGLPRQDMEFLFEFAGATPEGRIEAMRGMMPTTGFGETFQYSNTMVSTGGYAAARAAAGSGKPIGAGYDEVMQSRVFDPLGMKSTTFDFAVAQARDHAHPHGRNLSLEYRPIPLSYEHCLIAVRPAGGAWSSALDLARYVLTELAAGKDPEGERVVSEANLLERRKPRVAISDKLNYGLGLFVEDDHGLTVVHHGGNTLGFTADMYFLPDHQIGVVVLTNAGGANLFCGVVRRRLFEILFDGREQARESLEYRLAQRKEQMKKELENVSFHPDRAWLDGLAGTYDDANLGRVTLSGEGEQFVFDAGEWRSTVGQRKEKDGTLMLILTDAPFAGVEFLPQKGDSGTTLTLETAQQKYVFRAGR